MQDETTNRHMDTEEKHYSDEKESDQEIVIIEGVGENDMPHIKTSTNKDRSSKKFKIIIDPSFLYDDQMHGGRDRIESTILKSKSDFESDRYMEEEIEQDNDDSRRYRRSLSDQMELDIVPNDDQNSSVIKIQQTSLKDHRSDGASSKEVTKAVDEEVVMDPTYARILDEIVKQEFWQLEKY